jgi:CubicO group peptidase (beta-lactamase class C family)
MSDTPSSHPTWSLAELLDGYVSAPHPPTPGVVAVIVVDGVVVESACSGESLRYADRGGRLLPPSERERLHPDDLFDLASLTKLFSTITLLRLVDAGVIDLDLPLHALLPSYQSGDKNQVTLRHLLTHTSGLPAITQLWQVSGDRDDRIAALLEIPLESTPGARFAYSCVGFMTAMALAETATGQRFDALVEANVTGPLGLAETVYNPLRSGIDIHRIAATEFDDDYRGRLVRGEVHDENAFSLDGVSGNAGLFATAADLARFGEAVRTNGSDDLPRLLEPATHVAMVSDQLSPSLDPGFRHGLGWRIGDVNTTGPLAGRGAISHSGFTGTSLVIHPASGLTVVVLANRVHPGREWSEMGGLRQAVVTYAMQVVADRRPTSGPSGVPAAAVEPVRRRTARVLLRDAHGAVLLLRGHNISSPDTTFWFTPGGGIEDGEDARGAAVRELREETGLRVEPDALVGPVHADVAEFVFDGVELVQEQEYYLLDVPRFSPTPEGQDEIEHASVLGADWWTPTPDGMFADQAVWPRDLADVLARIEGEPLPR